jgi:hypothetical protein
MTALQYAPFIIAAPIALAVVIHSYARIWRVWNERKRS